jgi:hypothetical protein
MLFWKPSQNSKTAEMLLHFDDHQDLDDIKNEHGVMTHAAEDGSGARVRTPRLRYVTAVAYQVKLKFGTPTRSAANHKAVREYAVKKMKDHGHRPAHIMRDIELVVTLVFINTREQLNDLELSHHPLIEARDEEARRWCRRGLLDK